MQIIKKLILVLVCCVVLLTSFINPAAASFVPDDSYEGDPDMLDEGWLYDDGDYYIPYGLYEPIAPYLASQPNYPDFDPNDIPWEDAPQHVQNILYNTPFISTTTMDYVNPWKIPFVLVVTNGVIVRVIVGINLMFATYFATLDDKNNFTPTGNYVICPVLTSSGTPVTGVEYACCYQAIYNFETLEPVNDWHTVEAQSGGGNRFSIFSVNLLSLNAQYDFYCYGGNNIGPGTNYKAQHINANATGYPAWYAVSDGVKGFAAGESAFVYQSTYYPNSYFKSFVPMTLEQKQYEVNNEILDTNKSIWQTLKEVPGNILNGIQVYLTNLKNYLLYFSKDEPLHVNPFSNILTNIQTFFSGQMNNITSFKNSLSDRVNDVADYIQSGTSIAQSIIVGVPVLSAFVSFFVVFCVVRKVIGR